MRSSTEFPRVRLWPWLLAAVVLLIIVLGISRPRPGGVEVTVATNHLAALSGLRKGAAGLTNYAAPTRHKSQNTSTLSAEQIVAGKLKKFAQSRRRLAHGLAERHGITVTADVERFFDAVESGNWDEIETRYNAINTGDGSATTQSGRPEDIRQLWPTIVDAYGAAEQVRLWPAQKLLDYGNSVMDSLRPDMVYVGGTDPGRWIPELMNETGDGTPHIVVTQNGLLDNGYLDYVNLQYGNQLAPLTADDTRQAVADYVADYQNRLAHDQQFPDEPPQVRPGESAGITTGDDGQLHVGGPNAQTSVMALNELLLQKLMDQNPYLSFGLQESFPFKSTYADAAPLGPLMELRAPGGPDAFTADLAAQSLNYWSTTTAQLLVDSSGTDSTDALRAYTKGATAAANLLAAHDLNEEAEQVYRSAIELSPSNPEAVFDYVNLLMGGNRAPEALVVVNAAAQNAPDNQQLQNLLAQLKGAKTN